MSVSNYTNNKEAKVTPVTNEFSFQELGLDERLRFYLEYGLDSATLFAQIIDEDSFNVLNEDDFLTWAELGES